MDIRLPNGTVVRGIPDGLPKEDVAERLISAGMATAEELGMDRDYLLPEMRQRLLGGIATGLYSTLTGLGQLVPDLDDESLVRSDQAFRSYVAEALDYDSSYDDHYGARLAGVTGEMGPMVASLFLPGGQTPALVRAGAIIGPSLSQGGADRSQYEQETGEDLSLSKELTSKAADVGLGLLERAGFKLNVLKGLPKGFLNSIEGVPYAKRITEILANAGREGVQELGQGLARDLSTLAIYDENREIGGSAYDDLTLGAGAGAIFETLLGKYGRGSPGLPVRESQPAPPKGDEEMTDEEFGIEQLVRDKEAESEVRRREEMDRTVAAGARGTGFVGPLETGPSPTDSTVLSEDLGVDELFEEVSRRESYNLPVGRDFTVESVDGYYSVTQDGVQFGPRMRDPIKAAELAGRLSGQSRQAAEDADLDYRLNESAVDYTPTQRDRIKGFFRGLRRSDAKTLTATDVNLATGTSGYANENAPYIDAVDGRRLVGDLALEELIEYKVPRSKWTTAQKIDAKRVKSGAPRTANYSVNELRAVNNGDLGNLGAVMSGRATAEVVVARPVEGGFVIQTEEGRRVDDRIYQSREEAINLVKRMNDQNLLGKRLPTLDETADAQFGAELESLVNQTLRSKGIASDINSPEGRGLIKAVIGRTPSKVKPFQNLKPGEKQYLIEALRDTPEVQTPQTVDGAPIEAPVVIPDITAPVPDPDIVRRARQREELGDPVSTAEAQIVSQQAGGAGSETEAARVRREARRTANPLDLGGDPVPQNQQVAAYDPEATDLAQKMRDMLASIGLDGDFATRLVDKIGSARRDGNGNVYILPKERGESQPASIQLGARVIQVSLDEVRQRVDAGMSYEAAVAQSLNHEIIHALRGLDLFTAEEWGLLEKLSRTYKKPATNQTYGAWAAGLYSDLNGAQIQEEAIAEMLSDAMTGGVIMDGGIKKPGGKPRSIINKLVNFFKRMVGFAQENDIDSFEDLLFKVQSGEVGARERDQIRTLVRSESRGILSRPGLDAESIGANVDTDWEPASSGYDTEVDSRPISDAPVINDDLVEQRRARATEQGFDVDNVMYHGTPFGGIDRFRGKSGMGTIAAHITKNPRFASEFASSDLYQTQIDVMGVGAETAPTVLQVVTKPIVINDLSAEGALKMFDVRDESAARSGILDDLAMDIESEIAYLPPGVKMDLDAHFNSLLDGYTKAIIDNQRIDEMPPSVEKFVIRYGRPILGYTETLKNYVGKEPPSEMQVVKEDLAKKLSSIFHRSYGPDLALTLRIEPELVSYDQLEMMAPYIKNLGFDGYVDYESTGPESTGYAIFDASNIKGLNAEFNPDAVPEGADYGDDIMYQRSRVVYEVAPDPNNAYMKRKWSALTDQDRMEISQSVSRDTIRKAREVLKVSGRVENQTGNYLDESVQESFALVTQRGDPGRAARALGFVLDQDGMVAVSDKPFVGSFRSSALQIAIGNKSASEVDAIYKTLRSIPGIPQISGQSTIDGQMIIFLDEDMDPNVMAEAFDNALDNEYNITIDNEVHLSFIDRAEEYDYASAEKAREFGGAVGRKLDSLKAETQRRLRRLIDQRLDEDGGGGPDETGQVGLAGAITADGRLRLSHFAKKAFDTTNPDMMGIGLDRRRPRGHRATYFGITDADVNPYVRQDGLGDIELRFTIDADRVYDVGTDPDGLKVSSGSSFDVDETLKVLNRNGFAGFWIDSKELGKIALINEPLTRDYDDTPMQQRRVNVNAIMDGSEVPPKKLRGKTEVARYLEDRSLRAMGGKPRDIKNPRHRDAIARDMADEAIREMDNSGSAIEWYDATIRKTVEMLALKHPEIKTDRGHRTAFLSGLAVTSQNMAVPDNLRAAESVYQFFRKHGRFPIRGYGGKGRAMEANFRKLNTLIEKTSSMDEVADFLEREFSVRELNDVTKKLLGKKAETGEKVDETVFGSAILGPKIGQGFYSNLRGDFSPVTMDMWFMRTVGRLAGTLMESNNASAMDARYKRLAAALGMDETNRSALMSEALKLKALHERDFRTNRGHYDSGKLEKSEATRAAISLVDTDKATVDVPASGGERALYRDIVKRAIKKVENKTGRRIEPAAFQALIWYPEQDLYKKLGVNLQSVRQDYASATERLLIKEGYNERDISAAKSRAAAESGAGGVRRDAALSGRGGFRYRGADQDYADGASEQRSSRPEGAVDGVVAGNKSAADRAINYVPEYSVKASPDAQYVAQNPDDAIMPDEIIESRSPNYSPADRQAIDAVIGPRRTPADPLKQFQDATGESSIEYMLTKAKQAVVNRYARLEKLHDKYFRDQLADVSSLASVLFADRSRGVVASAIKYGVPVYRDGYTKIADFSHDGVQYRGLIDIIGLLRTRKYGDLSELAQAYAIAIRGKRLNAEGKKTPVSQNDINKILAQVDTYTDADGSNPIREWHGAWQAYNNKVIEFLEATGVLNAETSAQWRDSADYIPYYRTLDPGHTAPHVTKSMFGDMTSAGGFKAYKGSETSIDIPLIEAIVKNTSAAIDMGMRNIAQQRIARDMQELGLAEQVGIKDSVDAPTVKLKVGGRIVRFAIYDPLIFESMQAIDGSGIEGIFRAMFGGPASLLRETVTRSPGFMAANLMRDTLSAWVTSGSNFIPLISSLKGLAGDMSMLERTGVVGGYDFSNDPDNIQRFFDKEIKRRGSSGLSLNMFKTLWDALGSATTRSDAATRLAVYSDVYSRTGNEAEAHFQAMEVLNFSRRGSNPVMRAITASIPFLNARVQGLDVLYRGAVGRNTAMRDVSRGRAAASFMMRGSLITLSTAIYWAMVSDEEEYREQTREVRDNNWLIPVGDGTMVKLPVPFEVGLIFKTIPETLLDLTYGERTNREALTTLTKGVTETLAFDPIFGIQAIAPVLEASINYDSYTGRPIEPVWMSNLLPEQRSTFSTTELALTTSELMKGVPIVGNPMKVDHILRGYFGTIGGYVLSVTDRIARDPKLNDNTARSMPSMELYEYPVMRRFLTSPEGSGLKEQFYDLYGDVRQTYNTIREMKEQGRKEELDHYISTRGNLLAIKNQTYSIKRMLDNARTLKNAVLQSSLSPDQKRERIDQIDSEVNRILKVVPVLEAAAKRPATRLLE